MPFHPTCFEIFKRVCLSKLGYVDIDGLWRVRDVSALTQSADPYLILTTKSCEGHTSIRQRELGVLFQCVNMHWRTKAGTTSLARRFV